MGVLLDGLSTYGKTRGVKQAFRNGDGGGIMDVWPEVMEVRPTVLMVSVAGVAGLLSLGLSLESVDQRVSLIFSFFSLLFGGLFVLRRGEMGEDGLLEWALCVLTK